MKVSGKIEIIEAVAETNLCLLTENLESTPVETIMLAT